ncbi:hypothetical protein Bhyg_12469 [Pseudolycoriella hygida]|uniref:Uncharacterized protein n=1 Tax=Pseudolycoriella hygida TaxID=35572 RepID=A0A9Q0S0F5_9DIPT|nr:hypothetical protein Bhyg_12469 [Pseudolycoriella hygida]
MSESHEAVFLKLHAHAEAGLTQVSNGMIYICRICRMTPDTGIRTEREWMQHLLSDEHQNIHRNHQMLRKVLWDLDRTITVTNIEGISQLDILDYIYKPNNYVVDFSYLSRKSGGTRACYALMSSAYEVNKLVSTRVHQISGRKVYIYLLDAKTIFKFLKWRNNILSRNRRLNDSNDSI